MTATVAALLCALSLVGPAPASAQQFPQLQGQVTDLTRNQVLAGGRAQIDTALADLLQRENVQLFVLFVESTGGRTVTAYADEVARQNSLGGNDALLVVAVGDRTDAMWRGSQSLSRLTDRELEDVLSRRVEPLLARGDFPGAVVAGAEGVGQVAGEQSAPTQQPSGGGGGGADLSRLLLPALLIGGGFLGWRAISGRRRERKAVQQRQQETGSLVQEANAQLIAADEALRDAREEIGFVEAQFGEPEVAAYRAAVATASEDLVAAFTLRQRLDDAEPEDEATTRQIAQDVVERAGRVQAALDEQTQRIEQLRDLERTAPELLAALPGQVDGLEARIPAAERTRAGLERYADSSIASVTGNIDAARELIGRARAAITDGQTALGAEDRAAAGRTVRAAQQAVAEAGQMLDAIESLAASLRQAQVNAAGQLAAAAADVRAARAAVSRDDRADREGRVARAEATLQQAERELAAGRPDVLAATRLIAQADAEADAVLAELQEEAERRERERRILLGQIQSAEATYERVSDFIAARRRLIGSAARTRIAEAGRRLERARAIVDDDPAQALAEARRAEDLAEDAYSLATDDVDAYQPYGGGWGGPARGGVVFPIPIPFPMGGGGGWGGRMRGGGMGGGIRIGGGGGGRSVGGRW